MSDCRICGSDKPLVCDPCHIVALENARTAALEEAVKAIEAEKISVYGINETGLKEGFRLGKRAAIAAVKHLGAVD